MVRTDEKVMLKYLIGNTEIAPLVAKYIKKNNGTEKFSYK